MQNTRRMIRSFKYGSEEERDILETGLTDLAVTESKKIPAEIRALIEKAVLPSDPELKLIMSDVYLGKTPVGETMKRLIETVDSRFGFPRTTDVIQLMQEISLSAKWSTSDKEESEFSLFLQSTKQIGPTLWPEEHDSCQQEMKYYAELLEFGKTVRPCGFLSFLCNNWNNIDPHRHLEGVKYLLQLNEMIIWPDWNVTNRTALLKLLHEFSQ